MAYIGNPPANRFVAPKAATQFSGDGSTTAFTLDHAVGSDEDILVSVDGVIQEPSVAYAVSNGTTLTFTAAPSSNSGNNIFVYYLFRTVGTVSHPSNNALQASDITVDTTTLVTDSTNNRVGIGTASPAVALETSGDMAVSDTSTASKRLQLSAGASEHTINSANYGSDMMDLNIQAENTIFKNGLIGVVESMKIDSAGHITKPLQSAFLAKATAQNNIANGTTLQFGTEIFDQNGDFASNVFTAPVTGRYHLSWTIRLVDLDNAASYIIVRMETSNRNIDPIIDIDEFSSDVTYYTASFSLLMDMDANDTASVVYVQSGGSTVVDNDANHSFFSGYLVC